MKQTAIHACGTLLLGLTLVPILADAQDRSKDFVRPFDRVITIHCVAISPDGRYLAAGAGAQDEKGEAVIWDTNTLRVVSVFTVEKGIPSVAFSVDGKTLAAGSFSENCYLLDSATGKLQATLAGHGEAARGLAFSPDGKHLAVGSYDNSIRLWDYQNGKILKTMTGHTKGIYQLAYSPDGTTLATCSLANDYTARLWDPASGKLLRTWQDYGNSGVRGIAYDPKGQWLAVASPAGSVKLRDLKSEKEWANFTDSGAQWVSVAPSGKLLAVGRIGGKGAQIYPLKIGDGGADDLKRLQALLLKWEDDDLAVREKASQEVQMFGMMADPLLLKAMKDGPSPESRMRARLAREAIHSPKPDVLLEGHWQPILGAAFSPDSRILATGARDGQVILWDMNTYKQKATLQWPTQ